MGAYQEVGPSNRNPHPRFEPMGYATVAWSLRMNDSAMTMRAHQSRGAREADSLTGSSEIEPYPLSTRPGLRWGWAGLKVKGTW